MAYQLSKQYMKLEKWIHTRAETGTFDERLGFFRLKANIELEVLDVAIDQFSRPCDLGVRVPLEESGEC